MLTRATNPQSGRGSPSKHNSKRAFVNIRNNSHRDTENITVLAHEKAAPFPTPDLPLAALSRRSKLIWVVVKIMVPFWVP